MSRVLFHAAVALLALAFTGLCVALTFALSAAPQAPAPAQSAPSTAFRDCGDGPPPCVTADDGPEPGWYFWRTAAEGVRLPDCPHRGLCHGGQREDGAHVLRHLTED